MDQKGASPNVGAEVARRKRLINVVSIAGIIPLLGILEMMWRGIFCAPMVWAILASTIIIGHMAWVLMQMRCPNCVRFVRSMMKKELCPHCGAQFTQ